MEAKETSHFNRWNTKVETGDALKVYMDQVSVYHHRDCFTDLQSFLAEPASSFVCALYGLRRTGKSTLLYQLLAGLDLSTTAYIKLSAMDDMGILYLDLDVLLSQGFKTVLIDEITLAENFATCSNLLADHYAARGMKIILAGTDSLGFALAANSQLYDRIRLIHTTYISFAEYKRLFPEAAFDDYLMYGGTLLPEGRIPFRNSKDTSVYLDTAIVENIQNSLRIIDSKQFGFSELRAIYHKYMLSGLINRIIDDVNHAFLAEVVNDIYKSYALGSLTDIVAKHREIELIQLLKTYKQAILDQLREYLSISDNTTFEYSEKSLIELKNYLVILDVLSSYPVYTSQGKKYTQDIFTQPGLQYAQAKALVQVFLHDLPTENISSKDFAFLQSSILNDAAGRILEDNVIHHTRIALAADTEDDFSQQYHVYQYKFTNAVGALGEYDMVIEDMIGEQSFIYEIKHSSQQVVSQAKHLQNKDFQQEFESRHYPIAQKYVLYTGDSLNTPIDGVHWLNVEKYLEDPLRYLI